MLFSQVGVFIERDRTSPISPQGHKNSCWRGNQHRTNVKDKWEWGSHLADHTYKCKISTGQVNSNQTQIKQTFQLPVSFCTTSTSPYGGTSFFIKVIMIHNQTKCFSWLRLNYFVSSPLFCLFFFCLSVYAIWRLSACIMCPRTCSWSALIACLFPSAAFVLLWRHLAWLDHLLMTADRHTHCSG